MSFCGQRFIGCVVEEMGGGSLHHVCEDTRVLDIDDALVDGACQRSGSRLVLKCCGKEGGEAGEEHTV